MLVTVFTPVYNRAQSIRAVYESLCAQTNKDFEWLVINDGSTDGTAAILDDIVEKHKDVFPINYVKKENEGLSRTINRAVDLARGTLLMRLDSDDMALPEAVQLIHDYYPMIEKREDLCAVGFRSQYFDGTMVGYHPFEKDEESSITDFHHIHRGTGDRSEVMKLAVYKDFKYPEFDGEKFCTEGIVWNRVSQKYKVLYSPKAIYRKGFVDDSITSDIFATLKRNCQGTSLMFYELIRNFPYLPYSQRLVATIKYYRFAFYAKRPLFDGIPFKLYIVGLPIGLLVILYDFLKHPKAFS